MKFRFGQYIWMFILCIIVVALTIWGIFFVVETEYKISIFGIVAVVTAAVTSVIKVSIDNKHVKEREYDLLVIKEKQKVLEHFYDSFFEMLNHTKSGKSGVSKAGTEHLMLFKKGLMTWGSERLIARFIEYDDKLAGGGSAFSMIEDGNEFLKEIRKELGFKDSKKLNVISIILTADARRELS